MPSPILSFDGQDPADSRTQAFVGRTKYIVILPVPPDKHAQFNANRWLGIKVLDNCTKIEPMMALKCAGAQLMVRITPPPVMPGA